MVWPFGKKKETGEGPLIHIHEDFWMMRNLHPVAAWDHVADDIDEANDHAAQNTDPDTGLSKSIRMIEAPKVDYRSTGLKVADLAEALKEHMPFVPRFYATVGVMIGAKKRDPFGAYEEDAICFGFDAHCYIKVEADGDQVTHIWFEADTTDKEHLAALRTCFRAIDKLAPSVVADYWMYSYGPLADEGFVEDYFKELTGND